MEWPWGGKHLDFWQGVALERLGWEKALEHLHGELVQQDDYRAALAHPALSSAYALGDGEHP